MIATIFSSLMLLSHVQPDSTRIIEITESQKNAMLCVRKICLPPYRAGYIIYHLEYSAVGRTTSCPKDKAHSFTLGTHPSISSRDHSCTKKSRNCGNPVCTSSIGFSQPTSPSLSNFKKSPVIRSTLPHSCRDMQVAVYDLAPTRLRFQHKFLSQKCCSNCKCQRFELTQKTKIH